MSKFSTSEIDNNTDILDSREIQERLDYLTDEIQSALESSGRDETDFSTLAEDHTPEDLERIIDRLINRELLESSVWDEWSIIRETFDGVKDCSEWKFGMTFLRESYVDEDWAENECKGMGLIPNDLPFFIESNIDWDGVKDDLLQDYTSLDFDGVKYYYREY